MVILAIWVGYCGRRKSAWGAAHGVLLFGECSYIATVGMRPPAGQAINEWDGGAGPTGLLRSNRARSTIMKMRKYQEHHEGRSSSGISRACRNDWNDTSPRCCGVRWLPRRTGPLSPLGPCIVPKASSQAVLRVQKEISLPRFGACLGGTAVLIDANSADTIAVGDTVRRRDDDAIVRRDTRRQFDIAAEIAGDGHGLE